MDTQRVEVLGRNLLVGELIRADLEVALPLRDRGVDLIVYADRSEQVSSFAAVPVQMKASSGRSFAVDRKYERTSNLLLVHVWNVDSMEEFQIFALRYPEAVAIAELMKWTETISWAKGSYSVTSPGKKLTALLEPYKMSTEKWWTTVVGAQKAGEPRARIMTTARSPSRKSPTPGVTRQQRNP